MLRISLEQFDALAVPADAEIFAWHRDRLIERFPQVEQLARNRIDAFVKDNRQAVRGMKILNEEDVATYLDCVVMYGADFPEQPWASAILQAKRLSGAERVALLRRAIASSGVSL